MHKVVRGINSALGKHGIGVQVAVSGPTKKWSMLFQLLQDGEEVSRIGCIEYPNKPDGSMWVGVNFFTHEQHRRKHFNLFLTAVAIKVLHCRLKDMNAFVCASIANPSSLKSLRTYFLIDWPASDLKHGVILLRTSANLERSNKVIDEFMNGRGALTGGLAGRERRAAGCGRCTTKARTSGKRCSRRTCAEGARTCWQHAPPGRSASRPASCPAGTGCPATSFHARSDRQCQAASSLWRTRRSRRPQSRRSAHQEQEDGDIGHTRDRVVNARI